MAFKDTSNTFSDIAVTSRLEKVNSFLKQIDSIIRGQFTNYIITI